MTAAPLDLDALEAKLQTAMSHRESAITPRNVREILNAAPALFAAARERDKLLLRENGIGGNDDLRAEIALRGETIAQQVSESTRLREALEIATTELSALLDEFPNVRRCLATVLRRNVETGDE